MKLQGILYNIVLKMHSKNMYDLFEDVFKRDVQFCFPTIILKNCIDVIQSIHIYFHIRQLCFLSKWRTLGYPPLSIYLFIYLYIYPSVYLSIHLSMYLSIYLLIYQGIHPLGKISILVHAFLRTFQCQDYDLIKLSVQIISIWLSR